MFDLTSSSDLAHLLTVYGCSTVFIIVAVESMGAPLSREMTLISHRALRSPIALAA